MKKSGLTLVEVVLAVVLIVGLIGAVFAFYDQAADTRSRAMQMMDQIGAQRLVMERITGELNGALAYPFLNISLQGQTDQMTFCCASLPSMSVWSTTNIADNTLAASAPASGDQDMQIVTYKLSTYVDDNGQTQIAGLERDCQKTILASTVEEGQQIKVYLLTPNIQFLRLRYWDGTQFADSWSGKELPAGVEITIGAMPLPDGVTPDLYPYETFRRVVYLPSAPKPKGQSTMQGPL